MQYSILLTSISFGTFTWKRIESIIDLFHLYYVQLENVKYRLLIQ